MLKVLLLSWLAALLHSLGPCIVMGQVARWTLEEVVRIGSIDGPAALSQVGPIAPDDSGTRVYVGQRDRTVRVFDIATGAFVMSIGRGGEGPGDFQTVSSLGWKGDSLWVADRLLRRVTIFNRDGMVLETLSLPNTTLLSTGAAAVPLGLAPDGTFIAEGFTTLGAVATGQIASSPVVTMTRTGALLKLLGERDVSSTAVIAPVGESILLFAQPFPEVALSAVHPLGQTVAFVRENPLTPGTLQVTQVSTQGDTIYDRHFTYSAHPIEPSVVDSLYTFYGRSFSSLPGAEAVRATRTYVRIPPTYPPVTSAVLSSTGWLWLRNSDRGRETVEWLLLDESGRHRANVVAPAKLQIKTIIDRVVWGTTFGDLDVPYVVSYLLLP